MARFVAVLAVSWSLASIGWAAWVIATEPDRAAAAAMELSLQGGEPGAGLLDEAGRLLDVHAQECRAEFRRATSALRLAEAEKASFAPGPSREAIAALHAQLRCFPMDANAWLLLAFVEMHGAAPDSDVQRHVAMSYRYGPREAWIAGRRALFLCSYPTGIPKPLLEDARRDFAGILEARRIGDVVSVYRACNSADRKELDAVLAAASADARAAFAREIAAGGNSNAVR